MEIVIHYGLTAPAKLLTEQSQVQLRQAMILRLRVLIPAFLAPTALSGLAVVLMDGTAPGLWFRVAALLALLLWLAIRVIGTVPINSATLTWKAGSPPKDWVAQVDHAERFHIVGVWAAISAFAFFLTAIALQMPTS